MGNQFGWPNQLLSCLGGPKDNVSESLLIDLRWLDVARFQKLSNVAASMVSAKPRARGFPKTDIQDHSGMISTQHSSFFLCEPFRRLPVLDALIRLQSLLQFNNGSNCGVHRGDMLDMQHYVIMYSNYINSHRRTCRACPSHLFCWCFFTKHMVHDSFTILPT